MLHAIAKHKTTIHTRYLGNRDTDERRVPSEDEIISTVFGPLAFLSPSDNYLLWQHILTELGQSTFLPSAQPVSSSIEFWPKKQHAITGQYIEPDVLIRMNWDDNQTRIFLIEFKWGARLSGDDQLHKQWLYFLEDEERKLALHIFIAPSITQALLAPRNIEAGGDVWRLNSPLIDSALIPISWFSMRSIIARLNNTGTAINHWGRLVDVFLEKIGIIKFSGFDMINHETSLPESLPETIFWQSSLQPINVDESSALAQSTTKTLIFEIS